ncbi:MAG: nucleotide sugar dehydrogenase [Candidatus Calescibacterium sp.]|nr:nucleotide sugar dehydrogenase [Candidatus Calescibacterium sp.]MCX7733999.1 nucleotide sugar dehydrogenase [bacterium]MDW8086402.1 nucleotide sugar dehydrogenase [Candidatus Calescibacterium sp.]
MIKLQDLLSHNEKICVVGLGYVGLPLAAALSKYFKVIGFDKNEKRIKELKDGVDRTGEFTKDQLKSSDIYFSSDPSVISDCRFIIVAVPTPVDNMKNPDFQFLRSASETVGKYMKKGSIVVFESTVYPGATREICVPILERTSLMKWKKDFFVGYSPERINPGDKEHTIDKVVKVVSGDTPETLEVVAGVYGRITGIHRAESIEVAEAAKVIENIQRDINIALMNELSLIFHKIGLDVKSVLAAARTKWNFLPFEPGLVGGHCIPVDPYYLAYKSLEVGHVPELILAGRGINEFIPVYIAQEVIKLLIKNEKKVKGANVLVLGATFKENVPDVRNSKVFTMIKELQEFGVSIFIYDPVADKEEMSKEYQKDQYRYEVIDQVNGKYDCVVVAVKHKMFYENISVDFVRSISTEPPILVDVKSMFDRNQFEKMGIIYWAL